MGGGEKALLRCGERTLLDHAIIIATPQVERLALDVRQRSFPLYAALGSRGMPLLADPFEGKAGPLGGIVGGLAWVATLPLEYAWLATFPCDCPFLPHDLVARLSASRSPDEMRPVVAFDGHRMQNLCALWPRDVFRELQHGVALGEYRSVGFALDALGAIACSVEGDFFNINTPADLALAERHLAMQVAAKVPA